MTTSEPCAVCHVVPHKLGCPHGAGKVSMDVAVTVSAPPIPEGLCALSGCVLTPHDGPHSWEIVPYTDEALYGRPVIIGPDCRDGKHRACRGDAWDIRTDQPAVCGCGCHCVCDGSDDHPYTCDRHT